MSTASVPAKESSPVTSVPSVAAAHWQAKGDAARVHLAALLAVPIACVVGIAIHLAVRKNDPEPNTTCYLVFLGGLMGLSMLMGALQFFVVRIREWLAQMLPIIAGAVGLLCAWDIVTSGFRWLPLPYFPSPASVMRNLLLDWQLLFESTWHSLILLISGYVLGAIIGIITGICIGWFNRARYWAIKIKWFCHRLPPTVS